MPVHKVGYRAWNGEKTPLWKRWWIITETGFQIAFKSSWVRRILLISWLPVLWWGIAVFMFERTLLENFEDGGATAVAQQEVAEELMELIEDDMIALPRTEELKDSLRSGDKDELRHGIWTWLLMTFFRYPQGTAMLFLLGIVAPGLISRDIRSRAFLMYFSRPIGRLEYIVGKFMIPTAFLLLITTIPAICLYIFGVMLSPSFSVTYSTWDIPCRVLAASICLVVPTVSIALMLSSVTQESRFATFAWFTVWALGFVSWFAIRVARTIQLRADGPFSEEILNDPVVRNWSLISLYNNFADVQSWVFGMAAFSEIWPAFVVLLGVTVVSLFLIVPRSFGADQRVAVGL